MSPHRLPHVMIGLLWLCIIGLNLTLDPILQAAPSAKSIGLCAVAVVFILGPSIVGASVRREADSLFMPFQAWAGSGLNKLALICTGFMLAGTLIDYGLSGGISGASISQIRSVHVAEGIEFSPLRYLSLAAKSIGLVSMVFLIAQRAPKRVVVFTLALMCLAGLLETITYGGRAFLRVGISFAAAAVLVGFGGWIVRHKARVFAASSAVLLVLLLGNIWFNSVRVTNENEYAQMVTNGNIAAEAIGVGNLPMQASYGVGILVGYLITPIGFLDHFLNVHDMPPSFGAFTFQTLGHRFGYDSFDVKLRVDDHYADFGINYNIWATAFRELLIDTGLWAFLPVCLAIGILLRFLYVKAGENHGALILYVILVAWLLNSPFESIFKNRYVEVGFLVAVVIAIAQPALKAISRRQGSAETVGATQAPL